MARRIGATCPSRRSSFQTCPSSVRPTSVSGRPYWMITDLTTCSTAVRSMRSGPLFQLGEQRGEDLRVALVGRAEGLHVIVFRQLLLLPVAVEHRARAVHLDRVERLVVVAAGLETVAAEILDEHTAARRRAVQVDV